MGYSRFLLLLDKIVTARLSRRGRPQTRGAPCRRSLLRWYHPNAASFTVDRRLLLVTRELGALMKRVRCCDRHSRRPPMGGLGKGRSSSAGGLFRERPRGRRRRALLAQPRQPQPRISLSSLVDAKSISQRDRKNIACGSRSIMNQRKRPAC